MSWFDAVCNSFSTIATGGFCTRNASIASFGSAWIEVILIFFMAVSGLHFGLIFATMTGKSNNIFKSEIGRYYIYSLLGAGLVTTLSLWLSGLIPPSPLRCATVSFRSCRWHRPRVSLRPILRHGLLCPS